jgi:hypothetical protein
VNGYKKWITGMPWATHMTTAVRTGGPGANGISVIVIPTNSKGFTHRRIPNSGQKAGGASFVEMDDVYVPVDNLIGKENQGFRIIMTNFNKERFIMSIGCNRKARTCLALSFDYANKRHTFGKPLITNQIISHKLATIGRYVESHWAWLEQLAYHIKQSPLGWQDPEIAGQIALSKVHGGRILEMANREAQQIFGGAGYQKGGPGAVVEQMSRDLRMMVCVAGCAVLTQGREANSVLGRRRRERRNNCGSGSKARDCARKEARMETMRVNSDSRIADVAPAVLVESNPRYCLPDSAQPEYPQIVKARHLPFTLLKHIGGLEMRDCPFDLVIRPPMLTLPIFGLP